MDAQLAQASNEKVELAILWFLGQFCKTYVGKQPQHTSKVTSALKSDVKIEQACAEMDLTAYLEARKLWGLAYGRLDRCVIY